MPPKYTMGNSFSEDERLTAERWKADLEREKMAHEESMVALRAVWRYNALLSDRPMSAIQTLRSQVDGRTLHPMDVKKSLAAELVTRFHGGAAADAARAYFETRFQKKSTPNDIRQQFTAPEPIWICRLMVEVLKFAKSTSEARRLIGQGAVKVDGRVIHDVNFQFCAPEHEIIEVGKNRIAQAKKIL